MKINTLLFISILLVQVSLSQTFTRNFANEDRLSLVKITKLKNGGTITIFNNFKSLGIVSSNIEYSTKFIYTDSNKNIIWEKQLINTIIFNCEEDSDGGLVVIGNEITSRTVPSRGDAQYRYYNYLGKINNDCSFFLWKYALSEVSVLNVLDNDFFIRNANLFAISKNFIYVQSRPLSTSNIVTYQYIQLDKNGNVNWQKTIQIRNVYFQFVIKTNNDDLFVVFTNTIFTGNKDEILQIDAFGTLKNLFEINTIFFPITNNIFFVRDSMIIVGDFNSLNANKNSTFGISFNLNSVLQNQQIGYTFKPTENTCNFYATSWQYDTLNGNLFFNRNFRQDDYKFNTRKIQNKIDYLTYSITSLSLDFKIKKTSKVFIPSSFNAFNSNLAFLNTSQFELSGKYLHYFIQTDSFVAQKQNIRYPFYFNIHRTDTSLNNEGCASVKEFYIRDTFSVNFTAISNNTFRNVVPQVLPTFNATTFNVFTSSNVDVCFPLRKPVADYDLFQINNSGFPLKEVVCNQTDIEFRNTTYGLTESIQWIFPKEANLKNADSSCYPTLRNVQFTTAGIYPVSIVAFNGKEYDTLTKNITVVNFIPKPALGNDTTICKTSIYKLKYVPPFGAIHTFRKVGSPFSSSDTAIAITESGSYICAAITPCGTLRDTITILVTEKPSVKLGRDTVLCTNDSIILVANVNASDKYFWSNGIQDSIIKVNKGGEYIFSASNICGITSDTIKIVDLPKPTASFIAPTINCTKQDALFLSTVSNNLPNIFKYIWLIEQDTLYGSSIRYSFKNGGSKTVKHYVIDTNGCKSDSSTKSFTLEEISNLDFSISKTCVNEPIFFTNTSSNTFGNITQLTWNLDNNTTAFGNVVSNTYANFGNYTIQLKASTAKGCVDSIRKTITISPIVANAGNDTAVFANQPFLLNGSGGNNYNWQPAFLVNNNQTANPIVRLQQSQTFILTVSNNEQCTDTDSVFVKVLKPIEIPNAFSPNGDGINDVWVIKNLSDYSNAQLQIFNRYGQMVFSSTNYQNNFNGTFNGKPLPIATYYYVLTVKGNGFSLPVFKGGVTLLK